MFNFLFKKRSQKRIHLDYAATTPVRKEVLEAMLPYFSEQFGNASSVHQEGQVAHRAIDAARLSVARSLSVRPENITFTSGGTEGNNLALLGYVRALIHEGLAVEDIEVITTKVEHPSISRVVAELTKMGVRVLYAPIDEEGQIILPEFKKLLSPKTRLVSIAYVNSETGVTQDLGKITRTVHSFEKENDVEIAVHTDACQAPLWLSCAPERLGVDMLTLDAGKCYGPKGAGVLVHRPKAKLSAVTYGGAQEGGLRPGTENTPLVVGAAKAIVTAQENWESRSEAVASLRDELIVQLSTIDGVVLNGSREHRVANNVNISILGIDAEFAVVTLDSNGVAVSTRSACSGADGAGSTVVREMTGDEARAKSTLRFTLGEGTTHDDIKSAIEILRTHVEKMRVFHKTLTQG